jgi:hypothetical protein
MPIGEGTERTGLNTAGTGKTTAVGVAGICELVLEEGDRVWLAVGKRCRLGIWPPGEKEYSDRGDRSAYFSDPGGGNRVELWDFFREGDGAEDGVMALAEDGDGD